MTSLYLSINQQDDYSRTPLHKAILQSSLHTAHELIKCGCDLNAQDIDNRTPLHYAMDSSNLEAINMLLFYGADVNIFCNRNFTPFTYALYLNKIDIAQALFPYCDDLSCTNIYGYTMLHLAAWRRNPIAIDLVKAGADVNCITNYGESSLAFSLNYSNATLFKLIWSRCDYRILLSSRKPFLLIYIQHCWFAISDWLECLYLILESPAAVDLMEHCQNHLDEEVYEFGFFWSLLYEFQEKNVKRCDRITIINLCLNLGVKVNIHDINLAYEFYGFGEEVETFIYFVDWCREIITVDRRYIFLLPACICGAQDPNAEMKTQSLIKQMFYCYGFIGPDRIQKGIVKALGFFSLSLHQKQELVNSCKRALNDYDQICEKLTAIPEIPSLLELSRDVTREYIRRAFNVKKPWQFHDAVKNLHVPQVVKDIIQFKRGLH